MNDFNRYDMPDSVKNLIVVAVQTETYDAIEVYAAAVNFGSDWHALTDDICKTAFAQSHCSGNGHDLVVKAAELVWTELAK